MFKLNKKSKNSQARLGVLKTVHGKIQTPFFMPVATQGTIKQISANDIKTINHFVYYDGQIYYIKTVCLT